MREYPPLMEGIIVRGARSVIAAERRPRAVPVDLEQQRERVSRLQEAAQEVVHRVKIGGAMVEYLDKMMVGGKRLGDCAAADLRREGNKLRINAAAMTDQANLLASIAQLLQPNETVRTANARAGILAVLRDHFGADA